VPLAELLVFLKGGENIMANVSDRTVPSDWNDNFFKGLQQLQEGIAAQQNSRRLDLEQMNYEYQSEGMRQNQMIEKMKALPNAIQGMQQAGLDVTPEVVSGFAKSMGMSDDLVNTLTQLKPMTITQTNEQGQQVEVPVNKITAGYQAAVARGTESYRRGVAIKEMDVTSKEKIAREHNTAMLDKISLQFKNNPHASNDKNLTALLNAAIKMHSNGMNPSDVYSAVQNVQEGLDNLKNPQNNPVEGETGLSTPDKKGFLGYTIKGQSITNGQLINATKGLPKEGSTIIQDMNEYNKKMGGYKNQSAKDEATKRMLKKWPELNNLLGGK
jgi:hypothetical protein